MAPPGSNLTASQLSEALSWKLASQVHKVHSGEDASLELQDLDKRLVGLLSTIRYIHNAACPVNRLPPEVLALIFRMLQTQLPDFRPCMYLPDYVKDWQPVMAVCQYWRQTALVFSALWSSIYVHDQLGRDLVDRDLERSCGALLKVFYGGDHDSVVSDRNVMEALAPHCDRMKELHILTWHKVEGHEWKKFNSPAPVLESLTVAIHDTSYAAPSLPPLFAGHTPKLRKIALNFFTPWPTNNFCGLTHISLHNQPQSGRCPLSQFLDFLEASPNLQELFLIEAGPNFDDDHFSRSQVERAVILKHLRVLELGFERFGTPVSHQVVGSFLRHLVVPVDATTRLWWDHFVIEDLTVSGLFPDPSPQLNQLHKATKIIFSPSSYEMRAARPVRLLTFGGSTIQSYACFTPERFAEISRLDRIHELRLVSMNQLDLDSQCSKTMFQHMTSLRTLVVGHVNLSSVLLVLGSSDTTVLNCPALENLHILEAADPLIILQFVGNRARRGRPLRRLVVACVQQGGGVERDWRGSLEEWVEAVEIGCEPKPSEDVLEEVQPELVRGWPCYHIRCPRYEN